MLASAPPNGSGGTLILGVLFFLVVMGAGYAVLQAFRITRGPLQLGMAPAFGLAFLVILTTWTERLGAPPLASSLLVLIAALSGAVLAYRERAALRAAVAAPDRRRDLALVLAAIAIPAAALGVAFAGVEVPLSTHDGAHHVETIETVRRGAQLATWYPPGFHALLGAFLGLVPWIDTARGTFEASLGLSLLAPVGVFGLGVAMLRSTTPAAVGALLLSLTFLYPYHPQFWDGWPLAGGVLLAVGGWVVIREYAHQPSIRLALAGAVLAAGIVLTHGTELYTLAVGAVCLTAAYRRRLPWRSLPRHMALAAALALVLSLPYLSDLLAWASAGGASAVGNQTALDSTVGDPSESLALLGVMAVSAAMLLDLPVRLVLLLVGGWWALRHPQARIVLVLAVVFLLSIVIFRQLHLPLVQRAFSLVFPWGQDYRLGIVLVVLLSVLGGAGAAHLAQAFANWRTTRSPATGRRVTRVVALFASTFAVVSVWGLTVLLSSLTRAYNTYTADDVPAARWLRNNAQPGEVVANDWWGDAGVWLPYKAQVAVLMPRLGVPRMEERQLVLANVSRLEDAPEAAAAACALGVRYVYRGSAGTAWDKRRFPPIEELRESTALEEVFSNGQAVVFRTRLACP